MGYKCIMTIVNNLMYVCCSLQQKSYMRFKKFILRPNTVLLVWDYNYHVIPNKLPTKLETKKVRYNYIYYSIIYDFLIWVFILDYGGKDKNPVLRTDQTDTIIIPF